VSRLRPATGRFNSVGPPDTAASTQKNWQGHSQFACCAVRAGCDTEEGVVGGVVRNDTAAAGFVVVLLKDISILWMSVGCGQGKA